MAVNVGSRTTGTKRPVRAKRGGGPNTPKGKANSSQNSTKHGVRAKTVVILAEESEEEYEKVVRGWNERWEPTDYEQEKLVETLIQNDWMHRRAQRWLEATEARIVAEAGLDPVDWTAEQRHKMELMQRYKTTAERAFYRAWSALQSSEKYIMQQKKENQALRLRIAKLELEQHAQKLKAEKAGPKAKSEARKKRQKTTVLDQWVEIEVSPEGKTKTTLHPENDVLIERCGRGEMRRSWFIAACISCMACRMNTRGRQAMRRSELRAEWECSGWRSTPGWG